MKRALAVLIILGLAVGVLAQEQQGTTPSAVVLPSYDDNEKGLRKLFEDMLAAARTDDHQRLAAFDEMLVPTGLAPWFEDVFGKELGPQVAQAYETSRENLKTALHNGLSLMIRENLTDIKVFRLNPPCTAVIDEQKYAVLVARKRQETFYEVHVSSADGKRGVPVWFLAFAEKNFRYLGRIRLPQEPAPVVITRSEGKPKRIITGGNVQAARLLAQPPPHYPPLAKANGIQGVVKLKAVIGKDGRIHELKLISGHCWLVEAAVNAVRKWRYVPTLLEGEPVEVSTTIDVVFTLEHRRFP